MYKKDSTNNAIIFTYEGSKLMNNVSLKSSYKARTIGNTTPDSTLEDDLRMSDDDKDAFVIGVESTLPDIYEQFLKLTSGINNAYSINDATNDITIKIQDNKAYNDNVLQMVDATVFDCLVNGTMMRWYETCAHADFQKEYAVKYAEAMKKLSSRIFQLKKKQQSSSLGVIS